MGNQGAWSGAAREWLDWARDYAEAALEACTHCGLCRAGCVSYRALGDPRFTPESRIEAAARILREGRLEPGDLEKLYTCTMCGACTVLCPYGIETWRLVHAARILASRKGLQPESLEEIKRNVTRSGHSFTPDPGQPRRVLEETARAAGVKPGEPGEALYVPSPFETSLYPNVLRSALAALRASGVEATVSLRALDLGGNAAVDAAGLEEGLGLLQRAVEEAEKLGARSIVVSGCGADAKLVAIAEKLGLDTGRVKVVSIYELLPPAPEECRSCLLFPSCGYGRFEADKYPAVRSRAGAPPPRDRPPFTVCCGGGGGLNYLREKPLAQLRDRIVEWRAHHLAAQSNTIITPCIKCYTVIRYGLLKARKAREAKVEHLVVYVSRRLREKQQSTIPKS